MAHFWLNYLAKISQKIFKSWRPHFLQSRVALLMNVFRVRSHQSLFNYCTVLRVILRRTTLTANIQRSYLFIKISQPNILSCVDLRSLHISDDGNYSGKLEIYYQGFRMVWHKYNNNNNNNCLLIDIGMLLRKGQRRSWNTRTFS
jgi:hypothetical protein